MYIHNHTHNRLASNNNLYIMYIHNHTIKETRAHQPASHRPLKYVLQLVNCQYCLKNYSFESLFLVPPPSPPLSIHSYASFHAQRPIHRHRLAIISKSSLLDSCNNQYIYVSWKLDGQSSEASEIWGGCPGLPVLMSLVVSVDVKQHWTMLRHWSYFVPVTSADIRGH